MTITPNDIKLFASARMTDAVDGGGPMAGQALQDGLENNVFPDISSTIDLARGALQLRAVFAAVVTLTTDTLRQAHAILQDLPDAVGVGALLIPDTPAGTAREVQSLVTALNAAGDEYPFCGATPTTASMSIGDVTVPVAGTRAVLIPKARTVSSVSGSMSTGQTLPSVTALVPSDGSGGTVPARMPQHELRVPVVPGQLVYLITIPSGTLPGTERVAITVPSINGPYNATILHTADQAGSLYIPVSGQSAISFGSVDRVNGVISLVLPLAAVAGTDIVVTYAQGGATTVLTAGDLAAGAFDGQGRVQINLGAGYLLAGAALTVGGLARPLLGGVVYASGSVVTTPYGVAFTGSNVIGTYTAAGLVTVPAQAGQTITAFTGAKASTSYPVTAIRATLPANIDPATLTVTGETSLGASFTATASALGVFATAHVTGTYTRATGELVLTFAAATKTGSLAYAGTQLAPQASFADLWGLTEGVFPADGLVRVVRAGQVGVLRHTSTVAAATYAATNTVNVGRINIADVRVVGANGLGISSGWSVDLATGVLTVNSVSGWDQPVTIEHAIEHVALVIGVPSEAAVTLNRPLTRAFPSGSVLSTAVLFGDLQARAGAAFSQQAWDSVWSDTRSGPVINAQYQDATFPIVVTNAGAITERWAFVFRNSTQFDLIGETVGRVAAGDTATLFAPINPATAQPYMTVQPSGWGVWSAGNVLRLKTYGAQGRVWAVRTVQPGATVAGRDQAVLAARGDINQ